MTNPADYLAAHYLDHYLDLDRCSDNAMMPQQFHEPLYYLCSGTLYQINGPSGFSVGFFIGRDRIPA